MIVYLYIYLWVVENFSGEKNNRCFFKDGTFPW